MAKQDDYTRYTIRLPTPLYERVKEAAGEASVNSLVVDVLAEKFPEPIQNESILFQQILSRWEQIIERMEYLNEVEGATPEGLDRSEAEYEALHKETRELKRELSEALASVQIISADDTP